MRWRGTALRAGGSGILLVNAGPGLAGGAGIFGVLELVLAFISTQSGVRPPHSKVGLHASETRQQRPQLLSLVRLDHVIGVEPEGIIAGRVRERLVTRRGEAVDPRELEDLGPK